MSLNFCSTARSRRSRSARRVSSVASITAANDSNVLRARWRCIVVRCSIADLLENACSTPALRRTSRLVGTWRSGFSKRPKRLRAMLGLERSGFRKLKRLGSEGILLWRVIGFISIDRPARFCLSFLLRYMHNRNAMPRATANPPIFPPMIAPMGDLYFLFLSGWKRLAVWSFRQKDVREQMWRNLEWGRDLHRN